MMAKLYHESLVAKYPWRSDDYIWSIVLQRHSRQKLIKTVTMDGDMVVEIRCWKGHVSRRHCGIGKPPSRLSQIK